MKFRVSVSIAVFLGIHGALGAIRTTTSVLGLLDSQMFYRLLEIAGFPHDSQVFQSTGEFMTKEPKEYLSELGGMKPLATAANRLLVKAGLLAYVKTIYIGYEHDGEMVAALYGHADNVEVALALDINHPSGLLVDASHLTWRTLPVSAILRSKADLDEFQGLVNESCQRVREGSHDVLRDNEFFIKSKNERRQGQT